MKFSGGKAKEFVIFAEYALVSGCVVFGFFFFCLVFVFGWFCLALILNIVLSFFGYACICKSVTCAFDVVLFRGPQIR